MKARHCFDSHLSIRNSRDWPFLSAWPLVPSRANSLDSAAAAFAKTFLGQLPTRTHPALADTQQNRHGFEAASAAGQEKREGNQTMKRKTRCSVWIMLCSCAGMLVPHPCLNGQARGEVPVVPATQRVVKLPKPLDVSLDGQHQLVGRVLDQQGTALGGTTVHVRRDQKPITSVQTDDEGVFRTGALTGGVYQIAVAGRMLELRVWRGTAAPPRAVKTATVVVGPTVRAQGCSNPSCTVANCDGSCGGGGRLRNGPLGFMFHPLIIGAAIAAAIAIPLALDDDDDAS